MTMPTTPDSPAAVEYLAERMALDSGVRWRDMLNSDRNAWRYRAHKARHDANVKMPLNRPMCACFPGTCRGGQADLLDSDDAGDAFSEAHGGPDGQGDTQDAGQGDNWPFPGTEGASTGAEGAESETPAVESETKPARGRRPRKAAAEVE